MEFNLLKNVLTRLIAGRDRFVINAASTGISRQLVLWPIALAIGIWLERAPKLRMSRSCVWS